MDGLLIINKPVGCTSFHVVAQVRKKLYTQKVGHAGTLDPFASGVLVVAVGKGLRLLEYLQGVSKTYLLTIHLGKTSTTLDTEGIVVDTGVPLDITKEEIENTIKKFLGESFQEPPKHSALRVNGKRAYELARKGKEFELDKRKITIEQIALVDCKLPQITLRIKCSSGTYMRSLARDVGEALHVGGYAVELVRESVGGFCLDSAIGLDDITIKSSNIGISQVKLPYKNLYLSEQETLLFLNGVKLPLDATIYPEGELFQVRATTGDKLLGVAYSAESFLKIKKIIAHIPIKPSVA